MTPKNDNERKRKAAAARRRYAADPEKHRARAVAYRVAHPERHHTAQKNSRRRSYGLEPCDYATAIAARGPNCPICEKPSPPVIDHDHETGFVRGFPCNNCNAGLGFAQDDPEILEAMARYLRAAKRIEALI